MIRFTFKVSCPSGHRFYLRQSEIVFALLQLYAEDVFGRLVSPDGRMCLAVKARRLSGSVIDISRSQGSDWKRDVCKVI